MQINGIENSKKMAENCDIKFDTQDNNYALALGALTNGTTVIELANTYLPFANNGIACAHHTIRLNSSHGSPKSLLLKSMI